MMESDKNLPFQRATKYFNNQMKKMSLKLEYRMLYGADLNLEIISNSHVSDWTRTNRTLKDRFFTLPFRPSQKTKLVYSPTIYALANGQLICSPKIKSEIESKIRGFDEL